jgi:hypothetical protein
MAFVSIIESMEIENSTTKGTGTKKTVLWVIVAIVVVALGVLGGYALGQMNKQHEVDTAKTEATKQAKKDASSGQKSGNNSNQSTPTVVPKTVTETTCNADELTLATAQDSDSGAGTIAYNLVLANVGKRTCTLSGFPGVSLVNDNGNQVGSPAVRADNYTEKKLTLQPGTKVYAVVSVENSSNFDDGQCKAGATKFRVYPPNDTGYLSVVSPVAEWCPGFMVSPVLSM